MKPIKKIFFYLLWNQVKTFFQEKTFFSLPWVKQRQSMFFHVWHKKPFSQQKETFFSAEKLIFRRETWETELKPSTVKQKESMFVHLFNVFSLIFFLGEKLFSGHSFFRFIFVFVFYKKKCFFLLLFRFHVWNWVKTYFLCVTPTEIMVFHEKYFWFFFRWKEFVCETELKTLFKTCFLFHVWNRIETKWKFLCENKKNFFEWKLIFHEQDQQNVCISTCETPNPKKLYFKENIFFYSKKAFYLVMCETEIKPLFQQWNQGRVCFGHVKQKKTYYSF